MAVTSAAAGGPPHPPGTHGAAGKPRGESTTPLPPAIEMQHRAHHYLFKGGRDRVRAQTLLVVGVHREERAFGEAVAAQLPAADFDLLRIAHGLSGRRPDPDELAAYRRRHQALYAQILDYVTPDHRIVVDLHTGYDEAGPCADVLCGHVDVLRCIEQEAVTTPAGTPPAVETLRAVLLVNEQPAMSPTATTDGILASTAEQRWSCLKPDIPQAVWRTGRHLYIGVEVYLPTAADDAGADAPFGAAVVSAAAHCGLRCVGTRAQTTRPRAHGQ